MGTYAYRGKEQLIEAIAPRLEEAGWKREGEAELAEAVIVFCPSMSDLEDLCFGDDGLMQVMRPGTTLVDLSAVTPSFARETSALTTLSDLRYVEAPLVCKDMVAADAFSRDNLRCFATGEEDNVERVREVLDIIFSDVQVMSGGGAAQLARAAETLQGVAELVSAIEANALFAASRRSLASIDLGGLSVEPESTVAHEVLDAVKAGRFQGGFTCEMLMGELSAALMAADDYELIIPQAESALHLLELLAVIGGADMTPAALALVYGDEASSAEAGLDWERAEQLYAQEQAGAIEGFDELDGDDGYLDYYDDDDDAGELGFGYSVN